MAPPLDIQPDGDLDLLSLGAVVCRLDPGSVPFRKATEYQVHVSGGEYNVAANLSDCFRLRTAIATALVDYPIGDHVAERVRAMGVRGIYRHFEHDGVTGPNIATVFSDRGMGLRGPVVFYNRANEAAARLAPGDFDWDALFATGVRWFHSGGIFAALSETTPRLIIEAMTAARKAGAIVSFDLNYRARLWRNVGGQARAQAVISEIANHVDVLLGNEEDLQMGLGIKGPDVAREGLESGTFLAMIDAVVASHPNIRIVATTLREVLSTNRHRWSAVAWVNGEAHVAPVADLDVMDRVGGGDGFASGFIYGLLAGEPVDMAIRLGWAHGALLTTTPGDTSMATLEQVRALASGGTARIQR
jgi:2-dehydro-3-deoxygluconokinase